MTYESEVAQIKLDLPRDMFLELMLNSDCVTPMFLDEVKESCSDEDIIFFGKASDIVKEISLSSPAVIEIMMSTTSKFFIDDNGRGLLIDGK